MVSTFKDHDAIASWYICDERPVQYLPVLQARHELVQRLDPSHITYSVLDRGDNIGMYTNISESLGVDPYPYHHDGDNVTQEVRCHNIAAVWVAFFSRQQRYCC